MPTNTDVPGMKIRVLGRHDMIIWHAWRTLKSMDVQNTNIYTWYALTKDNITLSKTSAGMRRKCTHLTMFKPGFLLKPWGGDAKKPRAYKVSHWTDKKNVMLFLAKVQNPATNAIDIRHLIGSFVLSRGIVRQTHEALMLLGSSYAFF